MSGYPTPTQIAAQVPADLQAKVTVATILARAIVQDVERLRDLNADIDAAHTAWANELGQIESVEAERAIFDPAYDAANLGGLAAVVQQIIDTAESIGQTA